MVNSHIATHWKSKTTFICFGLFFRSHGNWLRSQRTVPFIICTRLFLFHDVGEILRELLQVNKSSWQAMYTKQLIMTISQTGRYDLWNVPFVTDNWCSQLFYWIVLWSNKGLRPANFWAELEDNGGFSFKLLDCNFFHFHYVHSLIITVIPISSVVNWLVYRFW